MSERTILVGDTELHYDREGTGPVAFKASVSDAAHEALAAVDGRRHARMRSTPCCYRTLGALHNEGHAISFPDRSQASLR